jgi:geranylgeranyl diphosphate synthase, type II
MAFVLGEYLSERKRRVELALSNVITGDVPSRLKESCEYSLMAGGKRLRPILTLAACEAVGGGPDDAWAPALALEMIHTYSLIHDDLPAMDNDDYRRGRLTNHKVYGEAMAILAGDALLTDAFALLGREVQHGGPRASRAALAMAEIATAAGGAGMVGGQVLDIEATGQRPTEAQLVEIHAKKTGALFIAAVVSGGIMGGAESQALGRLRRFGAHAGLGFQVIDDVLDVTQDLQTLGKAPGSDIAAGKTTYVDLLGLEGAKRRARECLDQALAEIAPFGARAIALEHLAKQLIDRTH